MARILVVEPDLSTADRYRRVAELREHGVVVCQRGREAMDLLAEGGIDLVLLEVMLGPEDGYQWLKRARFEHPAVPVIVTSHRGNARDITLGFELGASDYLIKPVHLDVLMARVTTQLNLKQTQDRLEAAVKDLQRLSDLKGRMVSVVSHELRTPLTSIQGALQLMGRTREDMPPRNARLVSICERNTERLIRLVNGVLTFARLEAGQGMRDERVDLVEVVQRACEELGVLALDAQVALVVQTPGRPQVRGDSDRLHQVVVNLLSNAIRYAPAGTEVIVAVDAGKSARVEIADKGPGIAEAGLPLLFQPFSQLDTPGTVSSGTGLGLAISREIVERHNGQIGVESVLGQGSIFWFTLPLDAGAPS